MFMLSKQSTKRKITKRKKSILWWSRIKPKQVLSLFLFFSLRYRLSVFSFFHSSSLPQAPFSACFSSPSNFKKNLSLLLFLPPNGHLLLLLKKPHFPISTPAHFSSQNVSCFLSSSQNPHLLITSPIRLPLSIPFFFFSSILPSKLQFFSKKKTILS